jgi:outer membrane lipoprotein-sorting protein
MRKKLLALTLGLSSILAANAEEDRVAKGLGIAQQADRVDSGWVDLKVNIKMILEDKSGNQNVRVVRNEAIEVDGDGDKSLIIFDTPKDIEGTVLLSFSHKVGDDDQWLYLPSLKRVKRISSSNKSGPFMGSDFAYEDMSSQEIEKYHYRFLRQETLSNTDTLVVERVPAYQDSGYSKQLVWIEAERYIPLQIEYYDRKNSLLKTQYFNGYEKYADKFWRVDNLTMVNHQKGSKTIIEFKDYEINQDLSQTNFTQAAMKRVR